MLVAPFVMLAGVVLGAGAFGGCASAPAPVPAPSLREHERVARWMTGSFSSRAQSMADSRNFFDIRLQVVPIWTDRGDGPWLYVEHAAADRIDRPYRQRVYHLVREADDAVRSDVYGLPGEALSWAGAWRSPRQFDAAKPGDLKLRPGCSVYFASMSTYAYEGGTRGAACASSQSGAAYQTSRVRVEPNRLTSWDRGYDATGRQVSGAEKGPYVFERVTSAP